MMPFATDESTVYIYRGGGRTFWHKPFFETTASGFVKNKPGLAWRTVRAVVGKVAKPVCYRLRALVLAAFLAARERLAALAFRVRTPLRAAAFRFAFVIPAIAVDLRDCRMWVSV